MLYDIVELILSNYGVMPFKRIGSIIKWNKAGQESRAEWEMEHMEAHAKSHFEKTQTSFVFLKPNKFICFNFPLSHNRPGTQGLCYHSH